MRKTLALLSALCLALGLTGCGGTAETQPAQTTPAPAYCEDGARAMEQGDYAGAVEAYPRAIEAGEDRAAAYLGRADSYMALAEEQTEDDPDLKGLALRDYEIALELAPSRGEHIYEVYEALGASALDAGSVDEALSYLRTALAAASDADREQVREQAEELTDQILTASVWYMDAPDSRYYAFLPDGTGRVMDPAAGDVEPLTYENEGFVLHITGEDSVTCDWTYDPDRGSYYTDIPAGPAEDGVLSLRLVEMQPRQAYEHWQRAILGEETAGRLNWAGDDAMALGAGVLYERVYGLMEALAWTAEKDLTEEESAGLAAAREHRAALQEAGGVGTWELYEQAKQLAASMLGHLPQNEEAVAAEDTVLDELFPVGEDVLLDYFRLLTGWVLDREQLSVPVEADGFGAWEKLEDVDHFFREGRLYLCLPGCALREQTQDESAVLQADGAGQVVFRTPLTLDADMTAEDEALCGYLSGDSWTGLMDMGYSTEVFALTIGFEEDMTCTDEGGYFPGEPSGRQSGEYAVDGRELTLTLAAEGYSPGTYRYAVIPMGESLYMTLLSDGIVYGQTAGSTYVFCGAAYEPVVPVSFDIVPQAMEDGK